METQAPVKIMAEVLKHDPAGCKFTVDRVLFHGFARFSKDHPQGSPLAARLFAIEGVTSVAITDNTVTCLKTNFDSWRTVGPAIGNAIREHLKAGDPAVNPDYAKALPDEDKLRAKVQQILDDQINPAIASHGGTISLLDVKGKNVYIQMGGGCQGCSAASVTLKEGVVKALRDQIPEIDEVLDTTDHAAGTNPYYRG